MRSAIFIDGAYLNSVLVNHHHGGAVDYTRLSNYLAEGKELLRTYYYDAPPFQSNPPTDDERKRFADRQRFFAALTKRPKFEVRQGRCQRIRDPDAPGGFRFAQKMVDVLLSVDLVRLASTHLISEAIILTGDSDFIPAVAVAKDDGVSIRLIHSPNIREVHRDLWDKADERVPFDGRMFDAVKR